MPTMPLRVAFFVHVRLLCSMPLYWYCVFYFYSTTFALCAIFALAFASRPRQLKGHKRGLSLSKYLGSSCYKINGFCESLERRGNLTDIEQKLAIVTFAGTVKPVLHRAPE